MIPLFLGGITGDFLDGMRLWHDSFGGIEPGTYAVPIQQTTCNRPQATGRLLPA
jgi:hypothetical protein